MPARRELMSGGRESGRSHSPVPQDTMTRTYWLIVLVLAVVVALVVVVIAYGGGGGGGGGPGY